MALTECENGHLYDTDQYASCPYCNVNMNRVEFGTTTGSGNGTAAPRSSVGMTVAPRGDGTDGRRNTAGGIGKTVGAFTENFDREPVTGWLVCIEGAEKGKDYRILAKNNSIGREEPMDICIKGDMAISRENHARIAYDRKYNRFYFIPAEGASGIYVNEEPVFVPVQLNKGDVIELGESKFIFIPFCDAAFNWKDGLKQGE